MVNKTRRLTSKKAKEILKEIDLKLDWINYRFALSHIPGSSKVKPIEKEPKSPEGWMLGMEGWQGIKFFLEEYFKDGGS